MENEKIPSKLLRELMEQAKNEALKSTMNQKHGAILFKGTEIIETGYNYNFGNLIFHNKYSVHAEADVILNAIRSKKRIKNTNLIVVRISKTGQFVNSKPCKNCSNFIKANEIINTYYST